MTWPWNMCACYIINSGVLCMCQIIEHMSCLEILKNIRQKKVLNDQNSMDFNGCCWFWCIFHGRGQASYIVSDFVTGDACIQPAGAYWCVWGYLVRYLSISRCLPWQTHVHTGQSSVSIGTPVSSWHTCLKLCKQDCSGLVCTGLYIAMYSMHLLW